MLEFSVTDGISPALTQMPKKIITAIKKSFYESLLDLRNYIITQKLSGQVLKHHTGGLWRAILLPTVTGDDTEARGELAVSASCAYAAIQEFGGRTRAHVIEVKNAKALAWANPSAKNGVQFAMRVNHPGSNIPARPYFYPSFEEKKPNILENAQEAMSEGVDQS